MEKIAFRMFLQPGCSAAYQARHDALWPELATLLRDAGIGDYSIYLDAEHEQLFAVLRRREGHAMDRLPDEPLMRRWWAHMADLMQTDPSGAPRVEPLPCLFHLD